MMDYESFKKELIERLKEFLPEKYQGWEISVSKVPKVNGYMESINLMPTSEEFVAVPNIYVPELFEVYQSCQDMNQVLEKTADFFVKGMEYVKDMTTKVELDNPHDKVIMALVNSEENKELLAHVPNRSLLDLSIIYRIMVELPDDAFNSAIITNDLADRFELSETELYNLAKENTPRLMPISVEYASDDFYILTNKYRTLGAAVMLYKDVLTDIADEFDNNLYVLPSSIHEVFIVPDYVKGADELREIVTEANATVVKKNEVLSNKVYFYEKQTGKLTVV
ncbi:Uncharacterised protein [uncultured Eubacterium sp.]|nr:Uncharacterised protein [uncultured Eubacterium sp.]